jgi:hypothetical protein
MASDDDKQEEEDFEDIPSEVESDASEVGNTSVTTRPGKYRTIA